MPEVPVKWGLLQRQRTATNVAGRGVKNSLSANVFPSETNPRFIRTLAFVIDKARCEKNALAWASAMGSNPSLSTTLPDPKASDLSLNSRTRVEGSLRPFARY
jgi:hypothetical protein